MCGTIHQPSQHSPQRGGPGGGLCVCMSGGICAPGSVAACVNAQVRPSAFAHVGRDFWFLVEGGACVQALAHGCVCTHICTRACARLSTRVGSHNATELSYHSATEGEPPRVCRPSHPKLSLGERTREGQSRERQTEGSSRAAGPRAWRCPRRGGRHPTPPRLAPALGQGGHRAFACTLQPSSPLSCDPKVSHMPNWFNPRGFYEKH